MLNTRVENNINFRDTENTTKRCVLRIGCIFGNHRYEKIQQFNDQLSRIGCPICKKEWAMNEKTQTLLPWDYNFQRMYRVIFGHKIKAPWWYNA